MFKQTIKDDLVASIVVFLVAMPLCLGIALASNAPLFSGVLAGIIGGLVVGFLSQSHVSVSGPSPGMIAVVIAAIAALGDYGAFLTALVLAGVIQLLIGRFRIGFLADFVPSNVVQGLLCAIGILIIIKQLPFAFGFFAKKETIMTALLNAQETLDFKELTYLIHHVSLGAFLITSLSFAVLVFWDKVKWPKINWIPGPLIVVLLGVLANVLFSSFLPALHLSNKAHLVSIPEIETLFHLKNLLHFPDFTYLVNYKIYFYAALIAAVASVETLLNLEAAEKIDTQKRYCSRNKELIAQGVGNVMSGCLGGLPVTSVVVRTTLNVNTGAKTKYAAIMHGAWLLLAVFLIPSWINQIPLATLAAILIFVGLKLASYHKFKEMYQKGMENFIPFIVTVTAIVMTNLLTGILCGILVSAFLVMKYNSKPSFKQKQEMYPSGNVIRILLPEQATFLNKASLIASLRALPRDAMVILDARKTHYLDYDIREVIDEFSQNLSREKNISLRLEGFKEKLDVPTREDFANVTTKKVQMSLEPKDVLQILKEGNKRFFNDKPLNRDMNVLVAETAKSQHPICAVISCSDSRLPVELIFDVGIGDLFVSRVAGNVVNHDIVASMEYATAVAGAKLIIVMGHTDCGAIKAACGNESRGNLPYLLKKIQPAVQRVRQNKIVEDNQAFFTCVTEENIKRSIETLHMSSELLNGLINDKKLLLLGAMYDIQSGKVRFIDEEEITSTDVDDMKYKDDTIKFA